MFNSGITTLNLAITGLPDRFAHPGNIVSYIGESDTGKTILALTTQAASFYQYGTRPLYYPFEPSVKQIDIERLYGKKFFKALEMADCLGMNLEDWQLDVRNRFKAAKKPMVCVEDSTDALKCLADLSALDGKQKKSKGEETEEGEGLKKKGTKAGMGGEAAASWSRCLSEVAKAVTLNEGLLVLTSQLRTKPGAFGSPYYRSNGAALDYYSEIRVWLYGSTKEVVDKVKVGGWTRFEVKRNKVTGEARNIFAPIYPSYGIDDTRAMLHFLADTDSGASWEGEGMKNIRVGEQVMSLAEMAGFYEGEGTKEVLQRMVVEAWNAREARLKAAVIGDRKPRFS